MEENLGPVLVIFAAAFVFLFWQIVLIDHKFETQGRIRDCNLEKNLQDFDQCFKTTLDPWWCSQRKRCTAVDVESRLFSP